MNANAVDFPGGNGSAGRRAPSQKRSRERVDRMLNAASTLIADKGSDALRMGEVAENAGVSIGSLYQFFPDKSAIIRTLAERYNALGRECIETGLAGVQDTAGLQTAFAQLIDIYYGIFLSEPVMRDIWFGLQADKGLRAFELAESRANGELLANAMMHVRPGADPEKVARSALLIMSLGESTMRLAISVERIEGDALIEAYKTMVLRELGAGLDPTS